MQSNMAPVVVATAFWRTLKQRLPTPMQRREGASPARAVPRIDARVPHAPLGVPLLAVLVDLPSSAPSHLGKSKISREFSSIHQRPPPVGATLTL